LNIGFKSRGHSKKFKNAKHNSDTILLQPQEDNYIIRIKGDAVLNTSCRPSQLPSKNPISTKYDAILEGANIKQSAAQALNYQG
jgi:hypothetical protein